MFLLEVIELLALVGLFVQAFVAWVFAAVLTATGRASAERQASRSFRIAFFVLAVALSVLSVRFYGAHERSFAARYWSDGDLAPVVCYSLYLGLKVWFGFLLVRGSYQVAGLAFPGWLRAQWVLVPLAAAVPFAVDSIDRLLVLQAPVLVFCGWRARRVLPRRNSGMRLMRGALLALALSWTWHLAIVGLDTWLPMRPVLALNSYVDLAVQLMLGIGLVMCLMEDAHQRALEAEHERQEVVRHADKNEQLRALGTLVSGVAHELNNPLTVILGYAGMLRDGMASSVAAETLLEQAERCRGIVRSLSALAGRSGHPYESIEVESLVRSVVRGLAPEALSEGRRVQVDPMKGLAVRADRVGLEQIVANLVENGLHETPEGGVVTVSGRASDDGIVLRVRDEGQGLPEGVRDRIFEPFFTTKAPGRGTGLGLSIVHSIARKHGGSVAAADAPGGLGAVFTVRIPSAPEEIEGPGESGDDGSAAANPAGAGGGLEPAPPLPSGADGGRRQRGEGARLLVIDDEAAVRVVIKHQASARGWRVDEAETAEAALELDLEGYAAILCDLRMTGLGGIGLHDHLAERRPTALARVVFVTGDLASEDSMLFSERCRRPLLQKPLDFDALFRLLDTVRERGAGSAR